MIELDRKIGEAIDIYVNDRLVARGEIVLVEDKLGVTMTEIIKPDRAEQRGEPSPCASLIVGALKGQLTEATQHRDGPRRRRDPCGEPSTRRCGRCAPAAAPTSS